MSGAKINNVLLVDDAAMMRLLARRTLERVGYVVTEAADGAEALSQLSQLPEPGLIVCDIHMPKMSGIELLANLKERGIATPVILLTGDVEPDLIERARELGAKAWLVKPLKLDLFLNTVRKALPLDNYDA